MAVHREQSGNALDHHLARVVLGLADQRDARSGIVDRDRAHPFGAGARLAGAAATENEPGGPVRAAVGALGCNLVGMSKRTKIGPEGVIFAALQAEQQRRQHPGFRRLVQRR